MGSLSIQNKTLQPHSILKLDADKQLAALDAAKHNRADEVFFSSEGKTYAATGEGWELDGLHVGTEFQFQNKPATVLFVDDEANSLKDLAYVPKLVGAVATVSAMAGVGYTIGHLITEKAGLKAAAKAGGSYALVGLAVGTLITGGVLAYDIGRSPNHSSLSAFASHK